MIKKTKKHSVSKNNKAIAVSPIQLPVAVKEQKKFSAKSFLKSVVFVGISAFVLAGVVCQGLSLYHLSQPRPLLMPKSHHTPLTIPDAAPQYAENVVAVVGDREITIEELQAFVAEIPQLKDVPFEQVYPKMLELLINNTVVAQGAEEMGIAQIPDVQKMIQVSTDQIITQVYLQRVLNSAITESDLRDIYNQEVAQFKPADEIHARHILLGTKEQAEDTIIQLQAGADFATLAHQKSLDKNAPDGDLGYFTKEMMIPEFAEAVFKMKKGEISAPVKTAYGWHVIQVEDRRKTQAPSFESQKNVLRQMAMERKLPDILNQERARLNVKIIQPTWPKKD